MSDFAPGFAGSIRSSGAMLQRAFAPADVAAIGRRAPSAATPRHFAPADPAANPTEGWDPFTPEVQATRGEFVDPVAAAHAAGVKLGREQMLAELEAERKRSGSLTDRVAEALAKGAHFDRDRMAGQLRQTVLMLVARMIGEAPVDGDLLAGRIAAATDLLADSAESALLRLHPDDVALVKDKLAASVFPVGDPHLRRGHFVLESASTIVEDGPDMWLEQLAQAIDQVPIPPLC
jgi:flagellar assembly protein FliH